MKFDHNQNLYKIIKKYYNSSVTDNEYIDYIIDMPIRLRTSIVTQLRLFDDTTSRITNIGRNKKELKYEIINLVKRLSEK